MCRAHGGSSSAGLDAWSARRASRFDAGRGRGRSCAAWSTRLAGSRWLGAGPRTAERPAGASARHRRWVRTAARPTRCWPGCCPTAYRGRRRTRPEFRRYTEPALRDGKRADAADHARHAARAGGRVELDDDAGPGVAARAERRAAGARHPAGRHRGDSTTELADDADGRPALPGVRQLYDWLDLPPGHRWSSAMLDG